MVSRPVRTTLCMKSARMAASMRGVVRRVSIGWRWGGGGEAGFGGCDGDGERGSGGRFGWRGVSGGI